MDNKIKIGTILVMAGAFLLILRSCISSFTSTSPQSTKNTTQQQSPQKEEKEEFEILELKFTEKNIGTIDYPVYSPYIIGKLKNNSNKTYSYVEIDFNLYDENGNQVGSTMTNINNLEPGKIWIFEAPVLEENAVRCKITNITAF